MTTCCVAGYRPLRDIRPDEATWPPVLAPAGPWEICDCAEGDVVRRQRLPHPVSLMGAIHGHRPPPAINPRVARAVRAPQPEEKTDG